MQKALFAVGALALFGVAQPASAQMCGGGQQAQTQSTAPSQGGMMMCGMMGKQADDPMADKPAQKPVQAKAKLFALHFVDQGNVDVSEPARVFGELVSQNLLQARRHIKIARDERQSYSSAR